MNKRIGEICKFDRGLTYSKADEVESSCNGVLRSNNIDLKSNTLCLDEIKYIKDSIEIPETKKAKKGSILICMANGSKCHLGKVAIIDIEEEYAFGGFMGLITPTEEIISKYLYYSLITPQYKKLIASLSDGANINNLKFRDIQDFEIPVPPLPEQERIVKILDAAFEKIDRLKQNAEKGLQEVKNLWQATLKEELKPKEGWNLYTLKDIIADISYGTSVPSCENGEYVYLRMNNITNDGRLDLKGSKTITLTEKELEKCIVRKGDILFNRTNSMELVGKSCVFDQDDSMVIAGYIIRIRLQKEYDPQFVSYSMNYMRSLGLFRNLIVGAVHQANISAKAIQTIRFSIPSLKKQQSIASKFDDIFDKCRLLRENYLQEIDKYESLKQSILRKAFSGEL